SQDLVDCDFMPLMVNYEERFYASGIIKGSRFVKREGRPVDESILSQRVVDRSIRPLFNSKMRNNTQVIVTIISADDENRPDMIAGMAASAALAVSDIPWDGPLGMVRVGLIDGKLIIQPTLKQEKTSDLDLVVASTSENVVMIEAGANEVSEDLMLEAIDLAKKTIKPITDFISKIAKEIGSSKFEIPVYEPPADLKKTLIAKYEKQIAKVLDIKAKRDRDLAMKKLFQEAKEEYAESADLDSKAKAYIPEILNKLVKQKIRTDILDNKKRLGKRAMDEVRKLEAEVGLFPRLHGSAMFKRGETQGLTTVTVGSPGDSQVLETLYGEEKKRYMHHYNFPPFATGETDSRLLANNRSIGHGALAERALFPMIPAEKDFPYTLRLVTEILSSNGSSSMAAVCGSTLALMDAGVPIKKPVAGVAMGMVATEDLSKFEILTDLQGEEDFTGDMDFKVAGTKDGITAIQMDIKVKGLTPKIFEQALTQARKGRLFILDKMLSVISEPRAELSKNAPRIITVQVHPSQIGMVIGKGGETINAITEATGVHIDINDEGLVFITSTEAEGAKKAQKWIQDLVYEPKPGDEFDGVVTKTLDFGAF
ncbi:MAG: polyribonucleotide nucleotidyltransferase, partial [Patescibacteria group bacterium]|nr:polyribonucleotide nucleotidyltransferase [Patescibacteria group bacterium]